MKTIRNNNSANWQSEQTTRQAKKQAKLQRDNKRNKRIMWNIAE